jgi:Xaa-Pro aminopeptidase
MRIAEIQEYLKAAKATHGLDGWLFFDHHHRDPISYRVLQFTPGSSVTRRWYYFVPAEGEPRGLVHKIEAQTLKDLPGEIRTYGSWQEMYAGLDFLLEGVHSVAMQYSHQCEIPYVAMVDAGTVEQIRNRLVQVVSSADLVQWFESRWNAAQRDNHFEAGRRMDKIRAAAFARISEKQRLKELVTEWEMQQFILDRFREQKLITDHGPDVAINANASNPHYNPTQNACSEIRRGDLVLIDMWAKLDVPDGVYYDITWVGYCGQQVPEKIQHVFNVVRDARDKAIQFVQESVAQEYYPWGLLVDDAARNHIKAAGFGEYFFHRTGHSIGTEVHGTGANMDNYETQDGRPVLPWTCFSIEPGIYLPEFGIRSEVDVFVDEKEARVTGEMQTELVII